MEETHVDFLEAQLAIGEAVIESMLELIPKKGRRWQLFPLPLKVMSLKLR